MTGFDDQRIAMVLARPAGGGGAEEVATGYFLTGDLVLTARHVGDRPECTFRVRAEPGESDEAHFSDATPVWKWHGAGEVDAMLLRTEKQFRPWEPPSFSVIQTGRWNSSGFARAAFDGRTEDRKTLPLDGTFAPSGGQGPAELRLTTNQIVGDRQQFWMGVSGTPVFATGTAADGLIGVITDASSVLANGLVAVPVARLLSDMSFRSAIWPSFLGDLPGRPFCAVLTAEHSRPGLVGQVSGVLHGFQHEDARFQGLHRDPIEIPILEAIASVENWAATVNALARAHFLVADVTAFEPAVMLLLGVRSVLRRGVTVSVTAGQLGEGQLQVPFNVQETRVLDYDDKKNFFDDLHRAMSEGAATLAGDANYLDLPAYHGVRAPRPETWADDDRDTILVLCPFSVDYSEFFDTLTWVVRANTRNRMPLRMLDLRSPRLVGQALYEQIRWASLCLVDWTEWRPNVFFELGVRLACSPRDPLSILQEGAGPETDLKQKVLLRVLFSPTLYDPADPHSALKDRLVSWSAPQPTGMVTMASTQSLPPGGTFSVAQAGFLWEHDPMLALPHVEHRQGVERILGKDPEKDSEGRVLFAHNEHFEAELNAAVREKWIAAWLYLRHLHSAGIDLSDDIVRDFGVVSRLTEYALKDSPEPRHQVIREEIRNTVGAPEERASRVGDLDDVLALKASAKSARDDNDWQAAIAHINEAVDILGRLAAGAPESRRSEIDSELADAYGIMGGVERRWGRASQGAERQRHLERSVAAYDEGFQLEQGLDLREASTYNRVNRLTGRVLLDPNLLEGDLDPTMDLNEELRRAEAILAEQVASARQKDPWVYCDLGTVRLLLAAPDDLSTFHELDLLRPAANVYESVLSALGELADVASHLRPNLSRGVHMLQRSLSFRVSSERSAASP